MKDLSNKKVAGTVILHLEDGSKKFLIRTTEDRFTLAFTDFSDEQTGLANILHLLKEEVTLDIKNIRLVELTNGQAQDANVPLFVFETQENQQQRELPNQYYWAEAQTFREIIQDMDIEGMPFF
ncbi:putative uncharacterized protein [Tetragenococcus halophilus subsp. halophilus]|nr:putative uncharacterized protein [Tetragenococcus halophilus subsp. halophilus]GBD62521.1 putative uncharacterized protein [Tetragenococcus halophilus subsp. halophilus]GBD73937.1 putative uncharacterized protein [Tetragenococcus halophilus subsp. halophilus]GBD76105.1 putative uncharacterized protein [Tetragenococcus halophilus subsp. halophilus]GMA44053.1 hypothetical protein GCM10025853_15100 [Tetragenococcus halophilus subsp. halophilus DSM 20339]